MLFPHTVTVYPSIGRTDIDGNTIRWPGPDGTPVPAFVQPRQSGEDDSRAGAGGPSQQTRLDAVAYLSHFCPTLDAFARIEFDGVWFDLVGTPINQCTPGGGIWFYKAHMRRANVQSQS